MSHVACGMKLQRWILVLGQKPLGYFARLYESLRQVTLREFLELAPLIQTGFWETLCLEVPMVRGIDISVLATSMS
jgi:hypothetical protein